MIKRCNDFGAGGVCVAIGELAPALDINLDKVPKKYEGLDGTELAISESQERMAVVVAATDAERFTALAHSENLEAVQGGGNYCERTPQNDMERNCYCRSCERILRHKRRETECRCCCECGSCCWRGTCLHLRIKKRWKERC